METFFSKVWNGVKGMWKKAPAVTVAAASAINFIVPFVETLDEIITPELAPLLNPILDKIKVGLTALKVTIQGVGPVTTVESIAASVNSNLKSLIAAAQIKNPALVAKIQAVDTLVSGELAAIVANHSNPTIPVA